MKQKINPATHGNTPKATAREEEKPPPAKVSSSPDSDPPPQSHDERHERTNCKPDQTPTWKIFLELITFLAAIAIGIVYWKELSAMLEMNRITEEGFHNEQRAWVGVKSANPVGFEPETAKHAGINLIVAFKLKNYGHSAAENVRFIAVLESDPTIKAFSCEEVEKIKAAQLLLPSQDSTINWVMSLSKSKMESGWAHQNPVFGHTLILKIFGCVEYSDRKQEISHRTPFAYLVYRKGGDITPDNNIPAGEIALDPYFEDSNQAR